MASSSAQEANENNKPKQNLWVKPQKIRIFMGPATKTFDSFKDQANFFLKTYWPNWTDLQSYLIPPAFNYDNQEISDADFKRFEDKCKGNNDLAAERIAHAKSIADKRRADKAEHDIYKAIDQLIKNGIQAPFLAIHSLDVQQLQKPAKMDMMFPHRSYKSWSNWIEKMKSSYPKSFKEYDFILIGPKIGLIVVEVKSTKCTQDIDFVDGKADMPHEYQKGLDQLKSSNGLLAMLQKCTEIELTTADKMTITKVLYTPNLQKVRFDNWIQTLKPLDKADVEEKTRNVIQWFKENSTEPDVLYENFEQLLMSISIAHPSISEKIFTTYAPILAAFRSISILKIENKIMFSHMSKAKFSSFIAATETSEQLTDHYLPMNKNEDTSSLSSLKQTSDEIQARSKIYFLTPNQQEALDGPRYQFIRGIAGTGKTIILQIKACELLEKGESVVVLSTVSYMKKYKDLFDDQGYTNYKIYNLQTKTATTSHIFAGFLKRRLKNDYSQIDSLLETIDLFIKIYSDQIYADELRDIIETDMNILIDDAADASYLTFALPLLITRLCQKMFFKGSVCWTAIDPCQGVNGVLFDQFIKQQLVERNDFSDTTLTQVMRCAETVFDSMFNLEMTEVKLLSKKQQPVLCHKIQGITVTKITGRFSTYMDALAALWTKIDEQIQLLLDQQIDQKSIMESMAILVCSNMCYQKGIGCVSYLRDEFKCHRPDFLNESNISDGQNDELTSENILDKKTNSLVLQDWNTVSSLEWPMVIITNIITPSIDEKKSVNARNYFYYKNYRAISRATAKLIDITFTCEELPSYSVKAWGKCDLDLLVELYKEYHHIIKNTIGNTSHKITIDEDQAWKELCDRFNQSVEQESRRTNTQIKNKIYEISGECEAYAFDCKACRIEGTPEPDKPPYHDVFRDNHEIQ